MALHLQPGRRLRATIEKYDRVETQANSPDVVMKSLLDLLQNRGWTNSLEDLGEATQALQDGEEALVRTNTENLLAKLVQRLAWSKDFTLSAMAHRYELKLEILTHLRGACPHTERTVTRMRATALNIGGAQTWLLPFADLQGDLDGYESSATEEQCSKCGEPMVRTVKHGLIENCAPDFLTVTCDPPVSLLASQNMTLKFSGTCYSLGALVQWSRSARSASVTRKMEDGWWWHGVDDGQGSDYKYSAEELSNSAHLRNAAVLLLTRVSATDETYSSRTGEPKQQSTKDGGYFGIETNREVERSGDEVFPDMQIEELNVEKERVLPSDVRGMEVIPDGILNGSKGHKEDLIEGGVPIQPEMSERDGSIRRSQKRDSGGNPRNREDARPAGDTLTDRRNEGLAVSNNPRRGVQRTKKYYDHQPIGIFIIKTNLLSGAEAQFQKEMAEATAASLKDHRNILSPEEVITKGIAFAAWNLGILCRRPGIHIPPDGNCLWTSICHALDPDLRGEPLKQEAWQQRLLGVGTSIEQLNDLSDDGWETLQSISVPAKGRTLTREEIRGQMDRYLENKQFAGDLGDILPQVAASSFGQPLAIVEIKDGKVTNVNMVKPGETFPCDSEKEDLIILVKQLDHFQVLHVDVCAKETAREKYRLWKISDRVNMGKEVRRRESGEQSLGGAGAQSLEGEGPKGSLNERGRGTMDGGEVNDNPKEGVNSGVEKESRHGVMIHLT